jgi:protein-S-isoprenylcysteine O-methyltransferase Ste14
MFATVLDRHVQFPHSSLIMRLIPASLTACAIERLGTAYFFEPSDVLLLMSLVAEVVSLLLLLAAGRARDETISIRTTVLAFVTSYFFLVVDLNSGSALTSAAVPVAAMAFGTSLQIYAKITLGRSFGVMPANRGVVASGPYRAVRHPIYLGYLITHLGFLVGSFDLWNLCAVIAIHTLLALRALEEEKVLGLDAAYRAFSARTAYRIIPGLF